MIDKKKKMVSQSRHDGWHKPLVIQTLRINIYLIMSCCFFAKVAICCSIYVGS